MEISEKQTGKVIQRITDLADIEGLLQAGVGLSTFFRKLNGALAGYAGAYSFAHNFNHFEKVLDNAREAAVDRLFRVGLGFPIDGLSSAKRRFLELE